MTTEIPQEIKGKDDRFYLKHDKDSGILTIEVTERVAYKAIKFFRKQLPIEMMRAKLEYVNVTTEDGVHYKNVRRYTTEVAMDKVDIILAAFKANFIKEIIKSTGGSSN